MTTHRAPRLRLWWPICESRPPRLCVAPADGSRPLGCRVRSIGLKPGSAPALAIAAKRTAGGAPQTPRSLDVSAVKPPRTRRAPASPAVVRRILTSRGPPPWARSSAVHGFARQQPIRPARRRPRRKRAHGRWVGQAVAPTSASLQLVVLPGRPSGPAATTSARKVLVSASSDRNAQMRRLSARAAGGRLVSRPDEPGPRFVALDRRPGPTRQQTRCHPKKDFRLGFGRESGASRFSPRKTVRPGGPG